MNNKNKFLIYILLASLAVTTLSAISCSKKANDDLSSVSTTSVQTTSAAQTTTAAETTSAAETTKVEKKELILASTTSTDDSGLFDVLLPDFEKTTGYKVKLIAVGSGEAMTLGEKGEADVLLVHSRKAEDKFMEGDYEYPSEGDSSGIDTVTAISAEEITSIQQHNEGIK